MPGYLSPCEGDCGPTMTERNPTQPGKSAGDLIHGARRARRLTLEQLAERVGCSKSYLSAVENSRCGPPSEALLRRLEDRKSVV